MIFEELLNHEIKLGKSAQENDQLISDASDNDYWVHISNFPSGHCIVKSKNGKKPCRKIFNKILKRACVLVKQHSKYSKEKKILFTITQIKFIQKTNILGKVNVNNIIKQMEV